MTSNKLTREQKIKLLKGILKGEKRLEELIPFKKFQVLISDRNNPGVYKDSKTGQVFTKEELDKTKPKPFHHRVIIQVVRPASRKGN